MDIAIGTQLDRIIIIAYFALVKETFGDCSPSLRVESNNPTFIFISLLYIQSRI